MNYNIRSALIGQETAGIREILFDSLNKETCHKTLLKKKHFIKILSPALCCISLFYLLTMPISVKCYAKFLLMCTLKLNQVKGACLMVVR